MAISTAIGTERRARVSGYKIAQLIQNQTDNLPQRIAVLGQANNANQTGLSQTKTEITSAAQAATLYGAGSPLHQIFRILRPEGQDGIGGIPTIAFPQAEASGATATSHVWTITGTPRQNATHTVVINGRDSLDFQSYEFSVLTTDSANDIASKITDAISNVTNSPVTATSSTNTVTISTKWRGESSAELKTRIDVRGNAAGLTYSQTTTTAGTGVADISGALSQFQNDWFTLVINPYGDNSTILAALEAFNGVPDATTPTGRWSGRVFMPFMAMFGSVESSEANLVAITNASARQSQVTNVLCPAPNSEAFTAEIAANVVRLFGRVAQDEPHRDVSNMRYPDLPVPANLSIGDMADYNVRDNLVKRGCSTVLLQSGAYVIQDLVTTYAPAGDNNPTFRYPRNINVDWNIKDAVTTLENLNVRDHTIVEDNQVTDVRNSVSPKQWRAVLFGLFEDLGERALLRGVQFSKDSLQVQRDPNNPDRINTFFRYRRTGTARITSTDVEVGF